MPTMTRRTALLAALAGTVLPRSLAAATPLTYQESPVLKDLVASGKLPPVAQRLPETPLVSDFAARKRAVGRYGGSLRTLVSKARDLRYLSANSYTRLVGYDEKLDLLPDLLLSVDEQDHRIFTFTLRKGHKWSDGHPFTTEDFRYYWEDVALNKDLSPSGPSELFVVDGKVAKVEILDEQTIRYSWPGPNPRFLPALAQPRPLTLFQPAHYMRQFHKKYRDKAELEQLAAKAKLKSWATLHNRMDDAYDNSNVAIPSLGPWRVTTESPATRFVFERNPYFHRVDPEGRQLPYVDTVLVDIAAPGLFAAKANAGEVDLLSRGLSMNDAPVLKEGEATHDYKTLLWTYARGSAYAFYPNLNCNDPVWRDLNRDLRYRKALSAAIDRRILNNALLFGLGTEGNNTVMKQSPLYEDKFRTENAAYDIDLANRLLDELGLTERDSTDIRKLKDGRILEIVVEVDGESSDIVDALQLVTEMWRDAGIKLFLKPQDRTILRQRSYAGQTIMVASQGLDNAVPTALMPPTELAPVRQEHFCWPKWGQYFETQGKNGEAADMPEAKKLMALYAAWLRTADVEEAARLWGEMLLVHAQQQFVIGTVSGELQPIVVNSKLRNVPPKALFSWEPTSLMGIYRVDEFFMES
ncbi:MAG: ABC transporter substrate-binding protein [Alsobacter sp.]